MNEKLLNYLRGMEKECYVYNKKDYSVKEMEKMGFSLKEQYSNISKMLLENDRLSVKLLLIGFGFVIFGLIISGITPFGQAARMMSISSGILLILLCAFILNPHTIKLKRRLDNIKKEMYLRSR